MMNWKSGLAAVVLALFSVAPVSAQTYPSQTVKVVVAYAPGGTGDIVARLIATLCVPIAPVAPARFSTTTFCPSAA